jgi:hypothetical protein
MQDIEMDMFRTMPWMIISRHFKESFDMQDIQNRHVYNYCLMLSEDLWVGTSYFLDQIWKQKWGSTQTNVVKTLL